MEELVQCSTASPQLSGWLGTEKLLISNGIIKIQVFKDVTGKKSH